MMQNQRSRPTIKPTNKSGFKPRFIFLYVFVTALGLLIIGRLFDLQIIKAESYKERANRQFITPKNFLFNRGTIYFSDKNNDTTIAASMQLTYKLTINPKQITDPETVFNQI